MMPCACGGEVYLTKETTKDQERRLEKMQEATLAEKKMVKVDLEYR